MPEIVVGLHDRRGGCIARSGLPARTGPGLIADYGGAALMRPLVMPLSSAMSPGYAASADAARPAAVGEQKVRRAGDRDGRHDVDCFLAAIVAALFRLPLFRFTVVSGEAALPILCP